MAATWQSVTIVEPIPNGAIRFQIMTPDVMVPMEEVLQLINFSPDWIKTTK